MNVLARRRLAAASMALAALAATARADETSAPRLIGYTELRTELPGGRQANGRTCRAHVVRSDGVRELWIPCLDDDVETLLTDLAKGRAAMWGHWRPGTEEER